MLKRPFWFGVGAVAGITGSAWAQRKVRQQVDRFVPEPVQASASSALRVVRARARSVVGEPSQSRGSRPTSGWDRGEPQQRANLSWHPTDRRSEARRRAG